MRSLINSFKRVKPAHYFSTTRSIKPPVISLASYASGTDADRQALASQILDAGSTTGFFYVTDFPRTSLGLNFLDLTSKYFATPESLKSRDITPIKAGLTRGYLPTGSESGSPSLFERKEAFSYGFDGFNPTPQTPHPQPPKTP